MGEIGGDILVQLMQSETNAKGDRKQKGGGEIQFNNIKEKPPT